MMTGKAMTGYTFTNSVVKKSTMHSLDNSNPTSPSNLPNTSIPNGNVAKCWEMSKLEEAESLHNIIDNQADYSYRLVEVAPKSLDSSKGDAISSAKTPSKRWQVN